MDLIPIGSGTFRGAAQLLGSTMPVELMQFLGLSFPVLNPVEHGVLEPRIHTAVAIINTGGLGAGSYDGQLSIYPLAGVSVRIIRVSAVVLAIADIADPYATARVASQASICAWQGPPQQGDKNPDLGSAGSANGITTTSVRRPTEGEVDRLAESAATTRLVYSAQPFILRANPGGALDGGGYVRYYWRRVAVAGDSDRAALVVHYHALPDGCYPPR